MKNKKITLVDKDNDRFDSAYDFILQAIVGGIRHNNVPISLRFDINSLQFSYEGNRYALCNINECIRKGDIGYV